MKYINVALTDKEAAEYEKALALVLKNDKKYVYAPMIVKPAIAAFVKAAKDGRAMEFLGQSGREQE